MKTKVISLDKGTLLKLPIHHKPKPSKTIISQLKAFNSSSGFLCDSDKYWLLQSFLNVSGELFAVGSNSRTIYICQNVSPDSKQKLSEANIITTYNKYHKGSIYCLW